MRDLGSNGKYPACIRICVHQPAGYGRVSVQSLVTSTQTCSNVRAAAAKPLEFCEQLDLLFIVLQVCNCNSFYMGLQRADNSGRSKNPLIEGEEPDGDAGEGPRCVVSIP